MILSRRSFLKVAGLSAVAVAGASMFTGLQRQQSLLHRCCLFR